jgi:hypothetical protein
MKRTFRMGSPDNWLSGREAQEVFEETFRNRFFRIIDQGYPDNVTRGQRGSIMIKSAILVLCLLVAGPGFAGVSAGQVCEVFPADNIWNTPVDNLPVDPNSAAYIAAIGPKSGLHPDFGSGDWPPGSGSPIGIPYVLVPGTQPMVQVSFDYYDESDPGPYPIPANAPIEGGPQSDGDRHVLVIDTGSCILYELFSAYPQTDGSWYAGSGAIFDLTSDNLRPAGWTSADAAGLPIFPGLVRYDEVASGAINHALRFTAPQTRKAYVWPARHYASSLTETNYPPMGQRFRLKAGFDISGFSPQTQVILTTLKRYGMMLADNGSSWYISGAPDPRWNNDVLHELSQVAGSNFEAVNVSSLMISPDSAATKPATKPAMTVQINAVNKTANEQKSINGSVRFSRTGDLTKAVTVYYSVGGTAENGVDYVWLPGSVTIPAGTAAKNVLVQPVNNNVKEANRTVTITIQQNSLYLVGSPASATITIIE